VASIVEVNVLALTNRRITSAQSGYDLRVAQLCQQLPGQRHLMVVPLSPHDQRERTIEASTIFTSVREVEPLLGPLTLHRHLRRSDDHYLRRSQPAAFAAAVAQVETIIRERQIDRVVVFGQDLAEFAAAFDGRDALLDVCDSLALTTRRELDGAAEPLVGRKRWKKQLELWRIGASESRLPDLFRWVTTISEPDRRELLRRHGPADNVHVIPNGIDERWIAPLHPAGARRGVAFWGNLAFGPNVEALRFFVEQVFRPFLVPHGVELYVAGHSAPPWLEAAAEELPGIVLPGFVSDLGAAVRQYPIMVNPMRSGSGMKNKVLEAFGLGLVVVSTRLGVDALPDVRDDDQLVLADEPSDLGRCILDLLVDDARRERLRERAQDLVTTRYPWDRIGREWRCLLGVPEPQPQPASGQRAPAR
jgi:glycosyltransferase involved in cell wall biosynthesis